MSDATKDFRFSFADEECKETTYFFTVSGPDKLIEDFIPNIGVEFDDHVDALETEYGLHDYSCDGDVEICAYISDEVQPPEYLPLMTKWRDWFVAHGFVCGDITLRPDTKYLE